jgi:hypothetical protein
MLIGGDRSCFLAAEFTADSWGDQATSTIRSSSRVGGGSLVQEFYDPPSRS